MAYTANEITGYDPNALAPYDILDTPPEMEFDDLARLASELCDTPTALVSLIDVDRQWFKARIGFPQCETDLSRSVCAHGLEEPDLLIIPDLSLDARTSVNPLVVGEPNIRFYAGAPLRIATGQAVGMLCVIDTVSRPNGLTPLQQSGLLSLARQVVANLELRRMVRAREDQVVMLRDAERHLANSEARWRGLFTTMSEGFILGEVIRGQNGRIVDWRYVEVNQAWSDLVGVPVDTATGKTIREIFPGIEDEWVMEFADVVETGDTITFTRQVGVIRRWYQGRGFRTEPERFAVIFREVTDEILSTTRQSALLKLSDVLRNAETVAEMTSNASELVGEAMHVTRAGFGRIDASAEYVEVEPDWTARGTASIAGRHRFADFGDFSDVLARGHPVIINDPRIDPRTIANPQAMLDVGIGALVNMPVRHRNKIVALFLVHDSDARHWTDSEVQFLREVADRLEAGVARLDAEAQQKVLNEELAHRLKNTLAMVQAIASQTLKSIPDRGPLEAFEQRLQALGSAHEVLLRRSWAGADMRAIIDGVLTVVGRADRIDIDGPPLPLGSRAALSTSLVIHELATNALKYGALCNEIGRVSVSWQTVDGKVVLEWREYGGPPVIQPTRKGFGSRLLRLGLVGTGGADVNYASSGLIARMAAPVDEISEI